MITTPLPFHMKHAYTSVMRTPFRTLDERISEFAQTFTEKADALTEGVAGAAQTILVIAVIAVSALVIAVIAVTR